MDALAAVHAIVAEQVEDGGLWFVAQTAPEDYLQQELRRLHAAIEKTTDALVAVLAELDAEHRPDPPWCGEPTRCAVCKAGGQGSWPCVTRQIADELRTIVEKEGGDG